MTENTIRLLIVDDHTLFREGLQAIFRSVDEIEVVGEAATGDRWTTSRFSEDDEQPYLQHLQQIACRRPVTGHHQGA